MTTVVNVVCAIVVVAICLPTTETTSISNVTPRYGSLNGATKITINGQGFAPDQFNFGAGNEDLGNRVMLVSDTQGYECDILKDETKTTQVVCYTRAMPADQYGVRVYVDGELVPEASTCNGNPRSWSCSFYPHTSYTPTITSISPVSALPGTLLTIRGKLFTDLFGTNIVEATNGADVRITRVYVGGQLCELVDPDAPDKPDVADELYGLQLDSENSNNGYMICKPGGTYVGNVNVTFLVDGSYGRSLPNANVHWVSATNSIAMFQTHAEITGVQPSTGSLAGGTLVTITGNYFDNTDYPAEVTISGAPCSIVTLENTQIVCESPPHNSNMNTSHPGNRGMVMEIWNDTYNQAAVDIVGMTNPAYTQYLSSLYWPGLSTDFYTARMRGYFVPPSNNDYRFIVKGDDDVFLWLSMTSDPADMALIAYCDNFCTSYTSDNTQKSDRFTLQGGEYYYMELGFSDGSADDWFYVSAMMYETSLSYGQADNIHLEQQTIATTSTVTPEIQRITLDNWPLTAQSAIHEVQEMVISSDYLEHLSFRLGMYGVFTEQFTTMTPGSTIQSGLGELLSIAPDTVTVTTSITSATEMLITVTFISDRGDWPDLEGMVDDSTPMNASFTVTEVTKGQPSMDVVVLSMEGSPSSPISLTATADEVADSVLEMVSVRCPGAVSSPMGAKFYQGYETSTSYYESGQRTSEIAPFCGRVSSHNPSYIFREGNGASTINILSYPYVCSAYKGDVEDKLQIKYRYKECYSCDVLEAQDTFTNLDMNDEPADSWRYICVDARALIQNARPSVTWTELIRYKVYRRSDGTDMWFDDIYIGAQLPTTGETGMARYRRMVPSSWVIGSVSAVGNMTTGMDVTMTVANCASNMPMLQIEHAQGSYVGNDTYEYAGVSYPADASITVTRVLAASPPVSGTIDLTFNGYTARGISSSASANEMKSQLEAIPGMGSLRVEKVGTCSMATWTISWLTAPGDQPQLQVANSTNISGLDAAVSTATISDAGVFLEPIPIEMIRSHHDTPQVSVLINKISSQCTGNCSFSWTNQSTPTIQATSPQAGSFGDGTVLVIDGSGFDPQPANNTVVIGGEPCDVTSANETQLQCNIGRGPAGTHDILVSVSDKGRPDLCGSRFTFTYLFELDDVQPTTGSVAGGTILTVTGTGFSDNIHITVGTYNCDIIMANYSVIECFTPAQDSPGAYPVLLLQDNTTADGGGNNFTADAALTPVVTNISTSTGSVMGGTMMLITGTDFGSMEAVKFDAVTLDGEAAEVINYNDTDIEVVLPARGPGSYSLKVYVDGKGFADTRTYNVSEIEYVLEVSAISPTSGSQVGGTRLTILGDGFSNASISDVEVRIHDINCQVEEVETTSIICITDTLQQTHLVDNSGTHPDYGVGYAWNPAALSIYVGDTVYWSWQTNSLVPGVGYLVQQTATAFAEAYDGTGFKSGDVKTETGSYSYQFSSAGIYYYWSGPVDDTEQIYMRGAVYVEERPSQQLPVTVLVNGFETDYNLTEGVEMRNDSCEGTISSIDSCIEDEISFNTSESQPLYIFSKCHTPTVMHMEPKIAPSSDVINIHGSGFSMESCNNDVTIGGYICDVISANTTHVECLLDPRDDLQVGVYLPVEVSIKNLGNALNVQPVTTERYFVMLPHISSVSPAEGSTAGGAEITITGSGFQGTTTVMLASYQCMVTNINYNNITCVTSNAFELNATVAVTVYNGDQAIPAPCRGNCQYQYLDSLTPTITGLSDTIIDQAEMNLTISGTSFGNDTSAVSVHIGSMECVLQSITDTNITCLTGTTVAGTHTMTVNVLPFGLASAAVDTNIHVAPQLDQVLPSSGSLNGGTLITITGLGFNETDISVTVDGATCNIATVTTTEVTCLTPAGSESTVDVVVISNGETFPTGSYSYAASDTPMVTSISPTSGNPGDNITVSGTNLGTDTDGVTVMLGDVTCNVTSASNTSLTCTVGEHSAGSYDVTAAVAGLGTATADLVFTFSLTLDSISPSNGSFGGGQNVTIDGHGFAEVTTNVTVCGDVCDEIEIISSTQLYCLTPPNTGSGTVSCDVTVSVDDAEDTLVGAYTYDDSLTPEVTSVSPARGGTGGGLTITITGTGFGFDAGVVSVTIAGTECAITSISDGQIECVTGPHKPSVRTSVRVEIGGSGVAKQTSAAFEYIDLWSSVYTWGDSGRIPREGDMVVIPSDMTVLLDVDTPVLTMLLIQGGQLIFDEKDVTLQATYILVAEGGLLQVGTEDAPFQHQATILLHGHALTDELPIYGAKVLAVREGTLDLHGQPPNMVWTSLGQTAAAGDNQIILEVPVDWSVGSLIAIATTGGPESQAQNELRYISARSSDGLTLTLDEPLDYKHLGETVDLGDGYSLEARAEVGLLSRNVVVRGYDDPAWHDDVPACEAGFNTGEFAVQTCFQGRFGEEIGSNQFGGHIIMHPHVASDNRITGRFSHMEVTFAGQAFRLGRYAIHFHLGGDMSGSYVRGVAIHRSFNRAVTVHGTHNVLIENNVIYNIMGGAFFLEDGIEMGNVFLNNLALFVIGSSSLQNDDITPAAFWVTNPNNTFGNNHVAGGTHFGFWYRMHEHPDGPSYTPDYCPRNVPQGDFFNNTVHSVGWFGIWIFQVWHPMQGGACDSTTPEPAKFYGLTAWNCEKGAEWVIGGAIQFIDFFLVNNQVAGVEAKTIAGAHLYSEEHGAMVKDTVIVARPDDATALGSQNTNTGIIIPLAFGLIVEGITFVNFDSGAALATASITGTSGPENGGFMVKTRGLTFLNSPNRVRFRWQNEQVLHDLDGTLAGHAGGKVVPDTDILPSDRCTTDPTLSVGVDGASCDNSTDFIRWAFNDARPASLLAKTVMVTNAHGSALGSYQMKRITHKPGWMLLLLARETYMFEFINAVHITNISYSGVMYGFGEEDYVIMQHNMTQEPDRFQIIPGTMDELDNSTQAMLTYEDSSNGDWYWDSEGRIVSYIISGKNDVQRRSTGNSGQTDRSVGFNVYQCFYADCFVPYEAPEDVAPETPDDAVYWDLAASWEGTEEGWGGNYGDGTYGPPLEGDDVKIPSGVWMIIRGPLPNLNKLYIYGTLEFQSAPDADGNYLNVTLSCTHILIMGGHLIVGRETSPFLGDAVIELRGTWFSEELVMANGPVLGAKALGVFGDLDLHGRPHNVTWTRLAVPAAVGDTEISVETSVDWEVGDEIIIVTTSYSPHEGEVLSITAISEDGLTLSLNGSFQYPHQVVTEDVGGGRTVTLAAEVGLFSHNIRVVGADYTNLYSQAFGARVIVGVLGTSDGDLIGAARVENVEFDLTGQEGFVDYYDPRYSLAFLDVGEVHPDRLSYVRSSAFHDGFAPAIGVFATQYLEIRDNVIHHTVGSGIVVTGAYTMIHNNLVTEVLWSGSFNGRAEQFNLFWPGGIDVTAASRAVLTGNVVAGSERAGFRTAGEPCLDTPNPVEYWSNNVAHSTLAGVLKLPGDPAIPGSCALFSNFTIYKAHDWGLYYQHTASLEVSNCVSIDNGVGLFPMVIKPPAASHQYANKYVHVHDSSFVGTSSGFNCARDFISGSETYFSLSAQARSWSSPGSGKVGLSFGTFSSGSNNAPFKPFGNIMSYNALYGITIIEDVHFLKFTDYCTSRYDVAITPNPNNDDLVHPMTTSGLTFTQVDENKRVYLSRPRLSKINPSDCVDMDCDGLKKCIIEDLDGTLLGAAGSTLLPESEWEWNGDPRRGLGDYRIPISLLTTPDGERINVDTFAPNKGIVRDSSCTYRAAWNGWVCADLDYEMLVVESLDWDTETRRVSPIALQADGYVDLVNGPQDHGWCAGYTCQKRLSTFPFIVATGKTFDMHFAGTTPQSLKFHLLNSAADQAVGLSIFYHRPQRLDVYYQGAYVPPKNAYDNAQGQQLLSAPSHPDEYKPDVSADPAGSNYFENDYNELYILIRGPEPVVIVTSPLLVISFDIPAMTVDEFFGVNLLNNLALYLQIPPENIMIANAVSASRRRRRELQSDATKTSSTRHRRAVDTEQVTLEISNPVGNDSSSTNASTFSNAEMGELSTTLINAVQLNTLGSMLNITILGVSVTEPVPSTEDASWLTVVQDIEAGVDPTIDLQIPASLEMLDATLYEASEASDIQPAPSFYMLDMNDEFVAQLGSTSDPWQVNATLRLVSGSHPSAQLMGDTTVSFIHGWANFTGLQISHAGTYAIDFAITSPVEAAAMFSNRSIEMVTITPKMLAGRVASQASSAIVDEEFGMVVELIDAETFDRLDQIDWQGHEWQVTASLYPSDMYTATLSGDVSVQMNASTGYGYLNMSIDQPSRYLIQFTYESTPTDYNFTSISSYIDIRQDGYVAPAVETSNTVVMRFIANYDDVIDGEEEVFVTLFYNTMTALYNNVTFADIDVTEGSILVTFTLEGAEDDVTATLDDLYDSMQDGSYTVDFNGYTLQTDGTLQVDGQNYITAMSASSPTILIAIIVAVAVTLVIATVILVYFIVVKGKKKTFKMDQFGESDDPSENRPSPISPRVDVFFDDELLYSDDGKDTPPTPEPTLVRSTGGESRLSVPGSRNRISPEPSPAEQRSRSPTLQGAWTDSPRRSPSPSNHSGRSGRSPSVSISSSRIPVLEKDGQSSSPRPRRNSPTPSDNPGSTRSLRSYAGSERSTLKVDLGTPQLSGSREYLAPGPAHLSTNDNKSPYSSPLPRRVMLLNRVKPLQPPK